MRAVLGRLKVRRLLRILALAVGLFGLPAHAAKHPPMSGRKFLAALAREVSAAGEILDSSYSYQKWDDLRSDNASRAIEVATNKEAEADSWDRAGRILQEMKSYTAAVASYRKSASSEDERSRLSHLLAGILIELKLDDDPTLYELYAGRLGSAAQAARARKKHQQVVDAAKAAQARTGAVSAKPPADAPAKRVPPAVMVAASRIERPKPAVLRAAADPSAATMEAAPASKISSDDGPRGGPGDVTRAAEVGLVGLIGGAAVVFGAAVAAPPAALGGAAVAGGIVAAGGIAATFYLMPEGGWDNLLKGEPLPNSRHIPR